MILEETKNDSRSQFCRYIHSSQEMDLLRNHPRKNRSKIPVPNRVLKLWISGRKYALYYTDETNLPEESDHEK